MNQAKDQILAKNIWELEERIKGGQGDSRTRLSLLRAYAQQTAMTEEGLEIPVEHRSFLKVSERGRDGVLLIHGSTGSPAQLRGMADQLRQGGFTVYGVRLPSHPASDEELDTSSWLASLAEAESRYGVLATYCRHLYVVGFSFGAALALQMNVRPRPRAMVLLAPALHARLNPFARLFFSLGATKWGWVRKRLGWKGEVLDSMEAARDLDWWHGVPVLAAMCKDDPRIATSSLSHIRKNATHERSATVLYDKGGHVFMDEDPRDELNAAVLDFLKQN